VERFPRVSIYCRWSGLKAPCAAVDWLESLRTKEKEDIERMGRNRELQPEQPLQRFIRQRFCDKSKRRHL
jgi:hypothetical protein